MTNIYEGNLDDLLPDDHNANKGSEEGKKILDKSIENSNIGRGVVTDKDDKLIAGNKTVEMLKKKGFSKTIVVETTGDTLVITKRTDLDLSNPSPDNPARQLAYTDNTSAVYGIKFDIDVLLEDKEMGINLEDLGLGEEVLKEILDNSPKEREKEENNDETALEKGQRLQKEYKTEVGQRWQLGRHTIACIDSCDANLVKSLISKNIVKCVWADPPYGISIVNDNEQIGGDILAKNGKYNKVLNDASSDFALRSSEFLLKYLPQAIHVWWGGELLYREFIFNFVLANMG